MQCFCSFLNWENEKVLQDSFGKDFLIVKDCSLPSPWSAVLSSRMLFWVAHAAVEANWFWGFTCWKGCEGQDWTSSWAGEGASLGRQSCLVHPQPWWHLCLLFPNGFEKFQNNIYCLVAIPALSAGARNGCSYCCSQE